MSSGTLALPYRTSSRTGKTDVRIYVGWNDRVYKPQGLQMGHAKLKSRSADILRAAHNVKEPFLLHRALALSKSLIQHLTVSKRDATFGRSVA